MTLIYDKKISSCEGMFTYLKDIIKIDLSNFDFSGVKYIMTNMFKGCYNLTFIDLSKFNTSKVSSIDGMFYDCKQLRYLDLSNFDISKIVQLIIYLMDVIL